MTLPGVVLGIVLSTLYGAAFHLWRGGGPGRLLLYLLLGWIGFWAGHAFAVFLNLTIGRLGPLQVFAGTLVSLFFLGVGYWLSLVEVERR